MWRGGLDRVAALSEFTRPNDSSGPRLVRWGIVSENVELTAPSGPSSRRSFLTGVGATVTAGALGAGIVSRLGSDDFDLASQRSSAIAHERAEAHESERLPTPPTNGDEDLFPDGTASFTKTLPHNEIGELEPEVFSAFASALASGDADLIDQLPGGGPRTLANPLAAHCFSLAGADPHSVPMPPVHALRSARQAAEAGEVYWMALARDVQFARYSESDIIADVVADMNRFSDFTGPRRSGLVTDTTVFRGQTPGDLVGPYVSQFLYADIPYGNHVIQQMDHAPTSRDFMVDRSDWLAIQNGAVPTSPIEFGADRRYLLTGRDLGEYVHRDYSYQAYLNAALVCFSLGPEALADSPYTGSARQGGFLTFGAADGLDLVSRAAVTGLRPAWFHKWLVHRKLRPEAFGGLVQNSMTGPSTYGLDPEFLNSDALEQTRRTQGSFLLSQAYPEGSPTHPSYPAGHATIAGAAVTVLKAIFDEDYVLPEPVVPSEDGRSLQDYSGSELTLGGELNKLANNIALGRNMAGVHWRADGDDGVVCGEEIALTLLQDHLREVIEDNASYRLTRFDGRTVRVTADEIVST